MVELSFCSSETVVKMGEQLERLSVRQTWSEGKVPAVNQGNASTVSLTCPELLLGLQQFPKLSRVRCHISYLLP